MKSQSLLEWINSGSKEKFSQIKWYRNFFIQHKLNKAVTRWNKDIFYITKCIKEYDSKFPPGGEGENYRPGRHFYWKQLVWQEITMYIRLNKNIDPDEFAWLCNRRGFILEEQNYLQSMMQYVGLMK